jgi:hypothetical protein
MQVMQFAGARSKMSKLQATSSPVSPVLVVVLMGAITCAASSTEPVKGAPTVEQAKAYFVCGVTGEKEAGGYLYLTSELTLEVAPGSRPYSAWTDSTPDIDPKQPVYSIRGSYVSYQCSHPSVR